MSTTNETQSSAAPLTVEMWGDLQSVWCYIEFGALRTAARELGDVSLRFRTYSLFPDQEARYAGDTDRDEPTLFRAGVANLAAQLGLDYDEARLLPTGSQCAHELVQLAAAYGTPVPMADRLFRAHFAEGLDIGDVDTLVELAAECGLDRDQVVVALRDGSYAAAVEQDNHLAYLLGAKEVPFAVINRTYTLTGTQTVGTVRSALLLARRARRSPGAPP